MVEETDGGGIFLEVLLPRVRPGADLELAARLHQRAHAPCYVARSVRLPVRCDAQVEVEAPRG